MTNATPIFGLPQNILECLNAYKDCCTSDEFTQVQSSIFRFTLPALGLPLPKGKRMTPDELFAARDLLTKFSIVDLSQFEKAQAETFQLLQTPSKEQRSPRSRLKKFISWVLEQEWVPKEAFTKETTTYRFNRHKKDRIKRTRLTNRHKDFNRKFSLSFEVSDYLTATSKLTSKQVEVELDRITAEIKEVETYMVQKGFKPYTIEIRIGGVKRFLGWLHFAKKVPLQELSLSSFIPVVRLKYSLKEFENYHDYVYAKGTAQEKVKEVADLVVKTMDDYFSWLTNPPSASTKAMNTETAITIAKFLYRHETDSDYSRECEDVPIVKRLRLYCNKFEEQRRIPGEKVVAFHKKAIPWEQVMLVLERLRYEANATHVYNTGLIKLNGEPSSKKREIESRAASFMKFLLLAMFTLMPPDRQRTFRELRLGETLKHGKFYGEEFIPREKMLDKSQAKYYIHLLPDDYKTGKSYGVWVGEIPNTEFSDGSKFYEYLDEWLYTSITTKKGTFKGLRNVLNPDNHNYVFFGRITGESLEIECLTAKIRHIFERLAGVPVTPHVLRKIFRTHIKEIGVSPQEEESISFWMKHDLRTANKDYTFTNCRTKLEAGSQLAHSINGSIFKNMRSSDILTKIKKDVLEQETGVLDEEEAGELDE